MQPRDAAVLEHILEYCEDIERYLLAVGGSFEAFLSESMCQHSIAFCILQIGELVGKLSDDLRSSTLKEINWTAIKGMRNIVVHDYGNVDLEEVWTAATRDAPTLKSFCKKLTDDQDGQTLIPSIAQDKL
jgi:uncharacterized protein with HEPN domain